MARRKEHKPKVYPGNPQDPESLCAWMLRHLEAMRVQHLSEQTIRSREERLISFLRWCEPRGLTRPVEITRPILESYQRHIFYHRKKNGNPLRPSTQKGYIVAVMMFFRWLTRQNVLLLNPAGELEIPRQPNSLPKDVLSQGEVEILLGLPDVGTSLGLRDRAILETFYSTGMRRRELVYLRCNDVDWEGETLRVREAKGGYERVVPIGKRALRWCLQYFQEVRPELSLEPDEGIFFLSKYGEIFSPISMTQLVRNYVQEADFGKTGACHLLRHAAATAMLDNGADIRFIQELLGHVKLTSTQIYTRVSIEKLKAVHAATHPTAKDPTTPKEALESALFAEADEEA